MEDSAHIHHFHGPGHDHHHHAHDSTEPSDHHDLHLHHTLHDPGHKHHHHHHADAASQNKEHWDMKAHEYEDIPQAKELSAKVSAVLLEQYTFDKESTQVLDFACGTGFVARSFAPHVKSVLGVDISQGMVDVFTARAEEQGLTNLTAVVSNILEEGNKLQGQKFDVIISSLAFHHMESMANTANALSTMLKPGGALLVADWLQPPSNHFHHHTPGVVVHGGITHEMFRSMFEGAGLKDISFAEPFEAKVNNADVVILVAKGVKPLSDAL